MLGSTALGHLIVLATLPVIGRLYLPADLGQVGTFLAFLGVASVGTSLRYDILIVSSETKAEGAALVAGVCWMTAPLSLLWSLLLVALIEAEALGFEVLPLVAAAWMFPALVATQLFFTVRYWLMRGSEFPVIARVTLWHNFVRATLPILFFVVGGGWAALVASEIGARMAGLGVMLRGRGRALQGALTRLAPGEIRRALLAYPESPRAGFPSALINSAANALPLPLLAGAFGVSAAGYFALVQRALLLPVSLIGRNVADVFHSRLADHARDTPHAAPQLFLRTSLFLLVVGGLPSLVVLLAGRPLLLLFMGSRWQPAAELLVAMIPWSLAMFVVSPLSRVVVVYRGQALKLVYDAISLTAVCAVLWWGPHAGWALGKTVWVLSWSQAGTYLIYYIVLYRLIHASTLSSVKAENLIGDRQ